MKYLTAIAVCISVNALAQLPSYVPINGLVGYWSFTGNAADQSMLGNNSTASGNAALTADRFGNANSAFHFDGDGDFIDCGNSAALDVTDGASVSAYIYADGFGSEKGIVTKVNGATTAYDLSVSDFGGQRVRWRLAGNEMFSNQTLVTGNWYHIVATYDGSSQKIYVDTELDNVSTASGAINVLTNHLLIGVHSLPQTSWNGKLDEVGIWNRALTQAEINSLFYAELDTCFLTMYDTVTTVLYDTVQTVVVDTNFITVTDVLYIDVATGQPAPSDINTISLYPNPAHTELIIDNGYYPLINGYGIRITNSSGSVVFEELINQQQFTLNLSTWGGNGTYIVQVVSPFGNVVATKQVVLQ